MCCVLGLLCNEAAVVRPHARSGGNPLDVGALGSARPRDRRRSPGTASASLPFDHDRRCISVLVDARRRADRSITKGAPEAVLARCVDVPAKRRAMLDARVRGREPGRGRRHARRRRRSRRITADGRTRPRPRRLPRLPRLAEGFGRWVAGAPRRSRYRGQGRHRRQRRRRRRCLPDLGMASAGR